MDSEKATVKPLTKEETKALLSFIESSKIINNKTTNATTNRQKIEEWARIAELFNATVTTCRRTPQQLRLKWENLKKNSRKRSTVIRMNNIKTGGGGPDYIPPDDILDRVAALLGSTVDGFTVGFGGDAEPDKCLSGVSGSSDDLVVENLPADIISIPCNDEVLPTDKVEVLGELVVTDNSTNIVTPTPKKKTLFTPRASGFKRKPRTDENRAARNQAIADYYTVKKKLLEANLNNILLENEKLKLEIEKLKNNTL